MRVKSADTGKEYVYKSTPLLKRDVAVQHVALGLQSKEDQRSDPMLRSTFATPKKALTKNLIQCLPGKSTRTMRNKQRVATCKNKCEICDVIYESKEDLGLERRFKIQNTWIGCDSGCDYWAHARCLNLKIPKSNKANKSPFKCPSCL